MGLRTVPAADEQHPAIRVVLIDDDPLSRQFLMSALARRPELRIDPLTREPASSPGRGEVILLARTPERRSTIDQIRQLVGRGHRVLAVGVHWSTDSIRDTLSAGACGCIVKSLDIDALVAAIGAAAAGHIVVSPDLLPLYLGSQGTQPEPPAPSPRALELLDELTARELEILGLLGDGLATREIATQLYVSTATVKSHVSHALAKLGVRNRVQAVLLVKDLGLLRLARAPHPSHDLDEPEES